VAWVTFLQKVDFLLHHLIFVLLFGEAGPVAGELLVGLVQVVEDLDFLFDLLLEF
jgi:hypothetical protein